MIDYEQSGSVAVVRIDRPKRRNALDREALAGLAEASRRAADDAVRALVLTGADGNFCSGADLNTVEDTDFVAALTSVLSGLRELPAVTIAAIEGYALGAGVQLALACDVRVATSTSVIGVPAAKLGLMVDWWTIERAASLCGQGTARMMFLTAERIDGERAYSTGLVQKLGGFDDAVTWARQIAELAPLSVVGHKVGLNQAESMREVPGAYTEAFDKAWASSDLQEGLEAFHDRRAPRFEAR